MEEAYRTLRSRGENELIERRSRFLGFAAPVSDEAGAQEFIAEIRGVHRAAGHNVFAYVLRSGTERCSDDGEPQGTAGVPVLEVLKKEQLVDAVVVVTRYFGGILLGAGGLIRAYSRACRIAVEAAGIADMTLCSLYALRYDYALHGKIGYLLQNLGARSVSLIYEEQIEHTVSIEKKHSEILQKQLQEATFGTILLKKLEHLYIDLLNS